MSLWWQEDPLNSGITALVFNKNLLRAGAVSKVQYRWYGARPLRYPGSRVTPPAAIQQGMAPLTFLWGRTAALLDESIVLPSCIRPCSNGRFNFDDVLRGESVLGQLLPHW